MPRYPYASMPTYQEIQQAVKEKYGFTPKTCWIAHVRSHHGLTTRRAPNRADPRKRKVPCPDDKWKPIEDTMRELGDLK